jgi:hypothetical protein
MKKLLTLTLVLAFISAKAQTTAQDWTKTDCDGNTHHLFDYLKSGKVVIMQFDMMNCTFCTVAATYTDKIYEDNQKKHPGKIVMFSMGYTNSTVCSDMQDWKDNYKFSFATIEKCPNEVAYYGGMGMPTIVIVGGWDAKVYYKKLGFKASDTADIQAALNSALAQSGMEEQLKGTSQIHLAPNPATDVLNIALDNQSADKITVTDLTGRELLTQTGTGNQGLFTLSISSIKAGVYIVTATNKGVPVAVSRFVKQ